MPMDTLWLLTSLLRVVLGVSVLLLAALLAAGAAARAAAAVRHRIWSLSIAAVLVLPAIVPFLPEWRIGLLGGPDAQHGPAAGAELAAVNTAADLPAVTRADAARGANDHGQTAQAGSDALELELSRSWARPADELRTDTSEGPLRAAAVIEPAGRADTPASEPGQALLPARAAMSVRIAAALWLGVMVLGLFRIVWSLRSARRLIQRAVAITDQSCLTAADHLRRRFSLARRPTLVESSETISPLCIGWWSPVVVLPAGWRGWPAEQLRAALAHELAHVRRRDVAWQLLARAACAVYWFHPLVWLAAWRMRVERELACDDCVLNLGERPAGYARTLLTLAAQVVAGRQRPHAGTVAMARGGQVEQRIRSVLRSGGRRGGLTRATGWALAAAAAGALLAAGVVSPLSPAARSDETEVSTVGERTHSTETRQTQPSDTPDQQPAGAGERTAGVADGSGSSRDRMPETSRIWHILRGSGSSMTLLHGLPQRLHAALDPSLRETELWKGAENGASLRLKIVVEGEADGEIVVGFFNDPRWYAAAPVHMRRFPGPGEYILNDLPPGRFHLGAMAGDLPRPAATGVGSTWPEPVELQAGHSVDAHVLVSGEFGWNTAPGSDVGGHTGDWGQLNQAKLVKVQVRDSAGRLLPWCRITFVERNEDTTHEFHESITDHRGEAYCDEIAQTFSIKVQPHEILPELLASRYVVWRMDALHDARFQPEINVTMEDFPTGTGRITGRVHNQHGEPFREYHLSLTRRLGELRSSDELREYCLRIPIIDAEGRFEVDQLTPGAYTATAFSFDIATHVLVWEAAEFTIPDEPNATVEVDVQLEARELRYGRAVYEDGQPVYPGGWTAWFRREPNTEWGGQSRSIGTAQDGSFRVSLSAEEQEQLLEQSAGLIEVYESGAQERRVTVAFDDLAIDAQQPPRTVVIPGTAPPVAAPVPKENEQPSETTPAQPSDNSTAKGASTPATTRAAPDEIVVSGRVIDEQGDPVTGAEVTALLPGPAKIDRSGDDGRFELVVPTQRLSGLGLKASARDGRRLAFLQLLYDRQTAAEVPAIELVLRPPREIIVNAIDADGRPLADIWTAATASYSRLAEASTDRAGAAVLRVPRDAPLQYVLGYKPGVGLDYFVYRREGEPASDPYKLPPDHAEALKLILDGTFTVTVRVVDSHDRPLPNVRVYPWYFERPNKGGHLNLSGLEEFVATTDERGEVTIRGIPKDNTTRVNIWAKAEGYFAPERWMFDPQSPVEELTARLVPLVPVRGRVTLSDGKPAAAIEVQAVGAGYAFDDFRASVRTQDDGTFEINVAPEMFYQFSAGNHEWASASQARIVRAATPVKRVEFALRPATRVFGRVTIGPQRSPLTKEYLRLYQQADLDYYKLPEAERLPNPQDSRKGISPIVGRNARTDDEGRFEFFVGPGRYYIIGPDQTTPPKFEIADERELEINLHAARPDTGPISGRVVHTEDNARPVSDATIWGVATRSRARQLEAVSDRDGHFQADRGLSEMYVHAATKDRRLAGIVKITADAKQISIPVGRPASAHGRLVDAVTGEPLANREIQYGVHIDFSDGTFGSRFGGSVKTDATGAFQIDGLAVGWEYDLNAVTDQDAEGNPRGWRKVGAVTPERAEAVDLGDVKLPPPYRAPTTAERIAAAFKSDEPFETRRQAKRRDARLSHQRVLVVAADPAGGICRQLFELYYGRDDDEVSNAFANCTLLPIDATSPDTPNEVRAWAKQLRLTWPGAGELTLGVLDDNGRLLAEQPGSELATGGDLDSNRLVAFLREHAPAVPDAEQLLAGALAEAKRDDKRVLVQHSGAYCAPCLLLSRFLDQHRALIAKDYVHVTIDERFRNGPQVIRRVRPERGGIPWMVILDQDGQPLITGDGPDGNIGYPSEPAGAAHFEKMLRTTARRLGDAEIEQLLETLTR